MRDRRRNAPGFEVPTDDEVVAIAPSWDEVQADARAEARDRATPEEAPRRGWLATLFGRTERAGA